MFGKVQKPLKVLKFSKIKIPELKKFNSIEYLEIKKSISEKLSFFGNFDVKKIKILKFVTLLKSNEKVISKFQLYQ